MTTSFSEIWVWLPRDRAGALAPSAFELLYEGAALCRRLGARLIALDDRAPSPEESARLAPWGVAEVRHLAVPIAGHPLCLGGHSPLMALAGAAAPRLFLFAGDAAGKVLGALWAAESGAALVTGATGITCDGERFVVARPALGEQFEALVSLELSLPLVVTLLPGSAGEVAPPARPLAAPPALHRIGATEGAAAGETARILPPDPATLDIADAERIVAFGRGAFSEEAIALVRRLAELLGAAVAGSRPAADEGWIPFARQVGLTGAIVRPRLYVAVGISGAPYHMAGVKEPETLIAINRDPEAPIFGSAHLGIVGDLHAVLPALIAALERGEAPAPLQAARAVPQGAAR
jgi:electron transfer flavoprotein alpha subunit